MNNPEIAKNLLLKKAVKLSIDPPFTWTSGIKSPIYCDNRLMISYPEERDVIVDAFVKTLHDNDLIPDIIAAEGGAIPWAAFVADRMKLPMIYIRKEAKKHGRMNKIEGDLEPGKKVLVIEDLISTGGSAIKAADAVKEGEGEVIGIVAIFTYQFQEAEQKINTAGYSVTTLTNFSILLEEAKNLDYIDPETEEKIKLFSADPRSWGDKVGV